MYAKKYAYLYFALIHIMTIAHPKYLCVHGEGDDI